MKQAHADKQWNKWGRDHYIEYGSFGHGNKHQRCMDSYIKGKNGLSPPEDLEECNAIIDKNKHETQQYMCAKRKQICALDEKSCIPQEYCMPFEGRSITIPREVILKAINMSFNIKVKPKRSGGAKQRNIRDIMYDNLQGKLAEIIIQRCHCPVNMKFKPLDFELYPLGIWDEFDIVSEDGETEVSVKSGLNFHQMLLLAYNDYDEKGIFKHHQSICNNLISAFVRMKLDKCEIIKKLMGGQESFTQWFLQAYQTIQYDVFFCSLEGVQGAIKNKNIIKKGTLLNEKIPMDATNYYLLVYNMERDINRVC